MNRPYTFSDELKSYLIKQYTEFNISVTKLALEVNISVPTIIGMLRKNGVTVSNKTEDKFKKYGKNLKIEISPDNLNCYYVYFHKTFTDDKIFYVGKGTNQRATQKSHRSKIWHEFVKSNEYYVEYFSTGLSETDALRIENEQILSLPNLLNKNVYTSISLNKDECSTYFKYSETSPSSLERIKGMWNGIGNRGKLGDTGHLYHDKIKGVKFWRVKFKNKGVFVHRLIWVLFNGSIPDNMVIDHIDGDTTNNSIENLRCITKKLNCINKKISKANSSGSTGIFYFNEDNLEGYRAKVALDGKKLSKRYYFHKVGKEEAFRLAIEWRKEQIRLLNEQGAGYTDRHGT